jgi:uncharacterized protein
VSADKFLDTSYAIGLASESDRHHARALAWADRLEADRTRLITTRAVLLEIGNALGKLRYRAAAVQLLSALESDPGVTIVPVTDDLYTAAFDLFQRRQDKEWGLTDCASFVVMAERGLTEALTTDKHFEQAGFVALLRRDPA